MPLTDRLTASSRFPLRAGVLIAAFSAPMTGLAGESGVAGESAASANGAVVPVVAPKPEMERWRFLRPVRKTAAGSRKTSLILPVLQDGPAALQEPFSASPQPLAIPSDAQPLPKPSSPLDALIQEHLGGFSPEEQQVWREELQDLPLEAARDILSARKGLEALRLPPEILVDPTEVPALPAPRPEPVTGATRAVKPLPPVSRQSPLGGQTTPPLGGQTVPCLRQAEQAALHNIANAATPGYQAIRCLTQESTDNAGVTEVLTLRDTRPGPIGRTGRSLDLAILGRGYFQVRQGDNVALTRSGAFSREPDGRLALLLADRAWTLHPEVIIPAEAETVEIDSSGRIQCIFAKGTEAVTVGQIELALPRNPALLVSAGDSLLAVPETGGTVRVGLPGSRELGTVRSGCTEASNVDLEQELRTLERLRLQISVLSTPADPMDFERPTARTAEKRSAANRIGSDGNARRPNRH